MSKELEEFLTKDQIEQLKNVDIATIDKHFSNSVYYNAAKMAHNTRNDQIIKGLKKYDEPLNPQSWEPQELIQHAFDENIDQQHYLAALSEKVLDLQNRLTHAENEAEYWRVKYIKASGEKGNYVDEQV